MNQPEWQMLEKEIKKLREKQQEILRNNSSKDSSLKRGRYSSKKKYIDSSYGKSGGYSRSGKYSKYGSPGYDDG